jgi:hypothetical protein
MSTLAVDLGFKWFLPNSNYPPVGFYTVTESTTPLPTTSYNLYTDGDYSSPGYTNVSTFKNSVIQPPESPDISLATTLEINYLGSTGIVPGTSTVTYTYSGLFTITLYPFINGSNIVINGGATTITTNTTYTDTNGANTQNGSYAGYISQSFPASSTTCTLYFSVDKTPSTETLTALNQ